MGCTIRPDGAAGRFAALVLLVATSLIRGAPQLRGKMAQVLVFDAGSSGTRVHIFNMYPPSDRGHVPEIDMSVRERQTLKVKPGLSAFATKGDYDGARVNIDKLIAFANQFVPQERRAWTPIMLKATAGLRAVPKEQSEAVLMKVREGFEDSGYRFRATWADIIQGKEEGGLAWLAANYLKGTFQEPDGSEQGSLGVIEMGGGSTQVTFEVANDADLEPGDDFSFVTALGRQYRLYAHSYLGFGQDYVQSEVRKATVATDEQDPCYPEGYVRKTATSSMIKGSGQAQSCKAEIAQKVLKVAPTAPGAYVRELPLRGNFVLTENFFYVQNDLSLKLEERERIEVADLDRAGEQVCGQAIHPSSEEVAKMESGDADVGNPKHCFGMAYQAVLLQTLQASAEPGVTMQIAHQINGGDVDWALGAALVHYLEGNTAASAEDTFTITTLLTMLLMFCIIGALYRMLRVPLQKHLKQAQVFKAGPHE